jgi:aerobic-type carbon monoxide dehydrogenase small subunit (CoxS/CutS family)
MRVSEPVSGGVDEAGPGRVLDGRPEATMVQLELTVDGVAYSEAVDPHRTLLRFLRDDLGLVGAKEGCDDSECGACMVLLDGRPVNACSYLAFQAAGRTITTVEGLGTGERLHPLQRAFLETGGIQCGFCTPGMLISAAALLATDPDPSDEAIRDALAGNLCRCTGYQPIFAAVRRAAAELRGEAPPTA